MAGSVVVHIDGDAKNLQKSVENANKQIVTNTKSAVAKLAAEYRKSGMSQSEAMKKAWESYERSVKQGAQTTKTELKGISSVVNSTKNGFSAFGNSIKSVGSIAKTALGVTVKGVMAVGSAIAAVAAIGIKYNADMESYLTNFEVLLGDSAKAAEKVAALKEMAAKTPFEMTELSSATQTLLAFGVESDKTMDILRMLGDVSMGNKERLASLALVFGQVQSAGRLTGQDLLQLVNVGFNPLQVISEKTGKSMEQLRDEMSQGKISADMVTEAFIAATSEGGRFYQGMEKASQTIHGQFSTLKDDAKALVGEVFAPLTEIISSELLPAAIGYIAQLSEAFRTGGVEGLVGAVGEIFANILTSMAEYAPVVIESAFSIINSIVQGLIDNMPQVAVAAVGIVTSLITGIGQSLPLLVDLGASMIVNLCDGLSQNSGSIITQGIEILSDLYNAIHSNLPTIVQAGSDLLVSLAQGIADNIPIITEKAPEVMNNFVNGIVESLPILLEAAVEIVAALAVGIITNLPQIISAGAQIQWALIEGIFQSIGTLQDKMRELFDVYIKAPIENKVSEIKQIGVNIVMGLWNGIQEKADWVRTQVSRFISSIKNLFTGIKGFWINSPSKWTRKLGRSIDEGLALGIIDDAKDVDTAFESLMDMLDLRRELGLKSEDEYYAELEKLRDEYLAVGTKSWWDYTKKIAKYQQDAYDDALSAAQKAGEDLAKAFGENVDEIAKKQDSLIGKLKDYGELYEDISRTYLGMGADGEDLVFSETVLADLSSQRKVLEDYAGSLDELRKREFIPEEFFDTIAAMSVEEGSKFIDALLGVSDAELREYIIEWEKIQRLSEQTGKKFYQNEAKNVVSELQSQFMESKDDFMQSGEEVGNSFMSGFMQSFSESASVLRDMLSAHLVNPYVRGLALAGSGQNITNYSSTVTFDGSKSTSLEQRLMYERQKAKERAMWGV